MNTNRTIAAIIAVVVVIILGAVWYFSTETTPIVTMPAGARVTPVSATTPQASGTPATVHAQLSPYVVLDGQTIEVDLAQTPAQQAQGLGGRTGLGSHQGMLFIFPHDGYEAFWMKDMQFSIDMIWLSADGTVVYIQSNVSPDTYPEAFVPTQPARYVLELPANFAKTYGVNVGDKAILP